MHAEWAELPADAVDVLHERRRRVVRIVAVGTTSDRTLETAAIAGALRPFTGEIRQFIRPGHAFRGLDALITNCHLPHSSLLVPVRAFAGADLSRAACDEAIRCRYRFFCHGDAMLILRGAIRLRGGEATRSPRRRPFYRRDRRKTAARNDATPSRTARRSGEGTVPS
jgi:S-adenosylmethionine:tRNA ribosyltransferase-isomerase